MLPVEVFIYCFVWSVSFAGRCRRFVQWYNMYTVLLLLRGLDWSHTHISAIVLLPVVLFCNMICESIVGVLSLPVLIRYSCFH